MVSTAKRLRQLADELLKKTAKTLIFTFIQAPSRWCLGVAVLFWSVLARLTNKSQSLLNQKPPLCCTKAAF